MDHGFRGYLSKAINEALEVYLGIQGYSAFLKGYGVVLKF